MGKIVIPGFRKIEISGGGEGGTTNYNDLTNKPSINNVPLVGNLKTVDLKLTDATLTEEGVPAEAKTVGAKLAEQSTSLTAVKEQLTKKANISDIPTKVSELQNDSNYQTDTDVTTTLTNYATKTYVGEQISSVDHLKREIVTEIPSPETADKNTIYMLKIESAMGDDKYREYLLIDGTVQCIGDTSVDLTDYAKKTEIPTELPANGGNSLTVNGHTVKSDVPENAVFTDTVYDDTEVQKRISDNGYGEVAGGKNLLNPDKTIIGELIEGTVLSGEHYISDYISIKSDTSYSISNCTQESNEIAWYTSDKTYISRSFGTPVVSPSNASYVRIEYMDNINAQLEEGSVATEYEPYIPSVKMLADEVSAQNDSLDDYGLLNKFDGLLELGGIDDSGNKTTRNDCARSVNRISCKTGDIISGNSTVLSSSNHAIAACFFNGTTFLSKVNLTNGSVIAPNNATNFIIMIYEEGVQITLSSIKVNVYVNNEIDVLKNDLTFNEIQTISTTQGDLKYRLNGNLCEYWFNGANKTSSLVTIGTLPVNPVEQFTEPLTGKNGGYLTISTNGIVKVALSDAYGSTHGMFSY